MIYRRNDTRYSSVFLYLLIVVNYFIRIKYMLKNNIFAFIIMTIVVTGFGGLISYIFISKKYNLKTQKYYMGILMFVLLIIFISFLYLIPKNI